MILLIDNYDSFVYNLARYAQELGHDVVVVRNDEITIDDIKKQSPSHIIISPGPCSPNEAGISNDVIMHFSPTIPILGICLGHQCIGHVFGATVRRSQYPMHGKTDQVIHNAEGIFHHVPSPFTVTRYHSLIIDNLPPSLMATAHSQKTKEIMAIRHISYPTIGLQFHPEAILTEYGYDLLRNFLSLS
jgi:anthranilate synthase component 2/para-aminobenzoate synthetase component 2